MESPHGYPLPRSKFQMDELNSFQKEMDKKLYQGPVKTFIGLSGLETKVPVGLSGMPVPLTSDFDMEAGFAQKGSNVFDFASFNTSLRESHDADMKRQKTVNKENMDPSRYRSALGNPSGWTPTAPVVENALQMVTSQEHNMDHVTPLVGLSGMPLPQLVDESMLVAANSQQQPLAHHGDAPARLAGATQGVNRDDVALHKLRFLPPPTLPVYGRIVENTFEPTSRMQDWIKTASRESTRIKEDREVENSELEGTETLSADPKSATKRSCDAVFAQPARKRSRFSLSTDQKQVGDSSQKSQTGENVGASLKGSIRRTLKRLGSVRFGSSAGGAARRATILPADLKLAVIGDVGAGKTVMIQCLSGETYENPMRAAYTTVKRTTISRFNSFEGMNVDICEIPGRSWDTFSDDLSKDGFDGVVLCFALDDQANLQRVQNEWFDRLLQLQLHRPVYLVGTKKDLRPDFPLLELDFMPAAPAKVTRVQGARLLGAKSYYELTREDRQGIQHAIWNIANCALQIREERERAARPSSRLSFAFGRCHEAVF